MVTTRPFVTIRPTSQSLVWDRGGIPPSPSFVIECGSRPKRLDIEVEMGPDPLDLMFNSCRGIPGLVPPADGMRTEGGGTVTYEVPSCVWEKLAGSPRVFYRAIGRSSSGKKICSLPESFSHELPFLHGLPSFPFYSPSCGIPDLPGLQVLGNEIIRQGGTSPFILRGVTISGLNHARYFHASRGSVGGEGLAWRRSGRWRDAAHITPELMDRLKGMGVNLIRLPLNQDWVLMGYHEPELPEFAQSQMEDYIRYLEDLDEIIAWASERGIYVLLALHTLRLFTPRTRMSKSDSFTANDSLERRIRYEAGKQPYNGQLPDHRSWLFWSVLAQRYRECSAVMFDLFNEPHEVRSRHNDSAEYRGIQPSFPVLRATVGGSDYESWWRAEWKTWAEGLEGIVHRINERVPVFISGFGGPCWSSSLEDMQIRTFEKNHNIVYAVHWYWNPALGTETWRRYLGMDTLERKDGKSTGLARRHPVFVKEWGVETPEAVTQESAHDPLSKAYGEHWRGRTMPDYPALIRWAEELTFFFVECTHRKGNEMGSGLAGFAAWSTGDKPRIFERDGGFTGDYRKGFPLTDFGRIVERALLEGIAADSSEGTP
jgi:hypothetical protein